MDQDWKEIVKNTRKYFQNYIYEFNYKVNFLPETLKVASGTPSSTYHGSNTTAIDCACFVSCQVGLFA